MVKIEENRGQEFHIMLKTIRGLELEEKRGKEGR